MADDQATAPHDWLVMLFLGGGNDLFEFGEDLIEEAKRVGSSDRVAIVAEHDPTTPAAETFRGPVLPGQWDAKSIGQTDASSRTIMNFVKYANTNFTAQKKLLVLWDHGNGWQNTDVFAPKITTATQPFHLAMDIVKEQTDIDILCFDACLMGMIEIAYELRGKVKFLVASENVVPADSGWPYDAILRTLTARPEMSPEQAACAILDCFAGSYNGSDQAVTLTALRLSGDEATGVDATVKAIDFLSRALIDACHRGETEKIRLARRYALSFGNPDYIDLISFCGELQRRFPKPESDYPDSDNPDFDIYNAADSVIAQAKQMIVGVTRSSARSVCGANGLSIYYPDRPLSALYRQLDFAKVQNCMWSSFLTMITERLEPRRPMRRPRPRPAGISAPAKAPSKRRPSPPLQTPRRPPRARKSHTRAGGRRRRAIRGGAGRAGKGRSGSQSE